MSRTIVLLASLAAIAAPASAATYVGKPVAAASEAKFVARDIVWANASGAYQGSTSESRPLVLCQSLAKRAGQLQSFTVDGKALAEADLAKCNSAAPATSASAAAEAN
jgi:hypothetical protein